MKDLLISTHSGLRWLVLLFMVYAVFNAFSKWRFGKAYSGTDKLVNLLTMILFHTQFLVGLLLYFFSDKVQFNGNTMSNSMLRFFTMEHFLMMTAVFVLLTMGRKRAEASETDKAKHRKYMIWYGICLVIVLAAIPWPFRTELAGAWFR
ncbi:MAG TPA: cytochrome B [Flavobacteriales bacterium]|nr:cytochrome B [Flavobacteriales bacterium]HRE73532.1 hypothetical protein [Flavobacteriales bacterium]HRE97645.1 hypothetical protein [Flavobacteriales bacterium]HRJ34384.1 hypothetical protein [Flavobacteriales bacterium]HRJ37334.1 hypothetical protein [Flavobacteriales bacterium]